MNFHATVELSFSPWCFVAFNNITTLLSVWVFRPNWRVRLLQAPWGPEQEAGGAALEETHVELPGPGHGPHRPPVQTGDRRNPRPAALSLYPTQDPLLLIRTALEPPLPLQWWSYYCMLLQTMIVKLLIIKAVINRCAVYCELYYRMQ